MSPPAGAVLGRCAFATARGLTLRAGGALAGLEETPQALEFRGRGGDLRPLPWPGEEVVFRRVLQGPTPEAPGRHLDLLGLLHAARDAGGRPGYRGGCAAVAHGDLAAYAEALRQARRLCEGPARRLLARAGAGARRPPASAHGARQAGAAQPGLRLAAGAAAALWLYRPAAQEAAEPLLLEGLRQVAWLAGYARASLLAFQEPRPGAVAVDARLIARCREAKQREIEGIEDDFRAEYERRLAEIEQERAEAPQPRDLQ